jgi:hypothetical protein
MSEIDDIYFGEPLDVIVRVKDSFTGLAIVPDLRGLVLRPPNHSERLVPLTEFVQLSDEQGVYFRYRFVPEQAGNWVVRFDSSGYGLSARERDFRVIPAAVALRGV